MEMMRNPEKLRPLIDLGCLVNLTAGSVAGKFGTNTKSAAAEMLNNGWASILATNARNLTSSVPDLMSGVEAAAKIIRMEQAKTHVNNNPRRIIGSIYQQFSLKNAIHDQ